MNRTQHSTPITPVSAFAAEPELLGPEDPAAVLSRRGFLKAAGFTFGGLAAAGCSRAPVNKAVPLLVQAEQVTPGRAVHYASTCGACPAGCGLLVTNRDGRPIKLEGNPDHPLSRGGLCAVGQASILGAYDSHRLSAPQVSGRTSTWPEVDALVMRQLDETRRTGQAVRFLTGTLTSPSTRAMIARFLSQFKDARHVIYDPLSCSAILDAHEKTHGVRMLPRYHFERAEMIVSFDADFLGTWISPVEYTACYRQIRQPDGKHPQFGYHVQIESRLSLTGSKADRRVRIEPSLMTDALERLLSGLEGVSAASEPSESAAAEDHLYAAQHDASWIDDLSQRLQQTRGKSLVVCGSNRLGDQLLCNQINHLLGNYGRTIDIESGSLQRQGRDHDVQQLVEEILEGKVGALFVHGVNPVYSHPDGQELAEAIRRVPMSVSFSPRIDETSEIVHCVCPDHHFLESWSDAEPVDGVMSMYQPALAPIGQTRDLSESLSAWLGQPKSAYDLLREWWQQEVFPRARRDGALSDSPERFQRFWDTAVHDGWVSVVPREGKAHSFQRQSIARTAITPVPDGALALVLYPKPSMLDGQQAYNPWLQELPDPISKATWDNYACLSPATAAQLGLRQNDVVRVEADAGRSIELPVLVQPGQADRTVAVALGYGTKESARFAHIGPQWLQARPGVGENGLVGVRAESLLQWQDSASQYAGAPVRLSSVGRRRELALTQQYHRLEVPSHLAPAGAERRPNVQETTLGALRQDSFHHESTTHSEHADLWPPDHKHAGHRWAMVIDLSACTGCSACVIACQVENNIPVVGQDEVRRQREMHWMRIDRYYTGGEAEPDVAFQPMLCQHCENAPCETACPVLATVHSEDGLNQQVYNRCVGTRYCANNCPYKVRRFNWFDYPRGDLKQNLVLNPDVTVRTRGVMEKCSFCAQRIQAARLEARRQGRPLVDGDVQPACQQTCAAGAIVFGDINDLGSRVSRLANAGRAYHVLEELNVKPSVNYLAIVRNRDESNTGSKHGQV